MIRGEKVSRPTKERICDAIAAHLQISEPDVSEGSSVDSHFLDDIHTALFGGPSGGADTYRKTDRLLSRLGRTYDPYWDTSESRGKTGGGTVTVRAYSQVLSAATGVDRCYLVPKPSTDDAEQVLRLTGEVLRGIRPFLEGGPGSRIIFLERSHGVDVLSGTAVVKYVRDGWEGPWRIEFVGYRAFETQIPVQDVEIPGWDHWQSITEVTPETFEAIAHAGGAAGASSGLEQQARFPEAAPAGEEPVTGDVAGDAVAERILQDFPADQANPDITIPSDLPEGTFEPIPAKAPQYEEADDAVHATDPASAPRPSRNPRRDRLAEKRAIDLTVRAFERKGWAFSRDRQPDGVGYDLEFTRGHRTLHVEVKGIQGPRLTFNLTPKEMWRAEGDEAWIVVAVTSVLSPTEYWLHTITRDRIAAATRVVTGYRVTL